MLNQGSTCRLVWSTEYDRQHLWIFPFIVAEPTQHCKDDEFRCGDSDQCVPYSTVCDARYDCTNKMDEPMSCGEFFLFTVFVYVGKRKTSLITIHAEGID